MTVYVLLRDDQSELGCIDVAIIGIFADERVARQREEAERKRALDDGLRVCV